MLKALFIGLFFSWGLWASKVPPYFQSIQGVIHNSASLRSPFEFTPGKILKCERDLKSGAVHYSCETKQSALVITNGASKEHFTYEKLDARFGSSVVENKNYHDYVFYGRQTLKLPGRDVSYPSVFRVRMYEKTIELAQGYLKSIKFHLQTPLTGTVTR